MESQLILFSAVTMLLVAHITSFINACKASKALRVASLALGVTGTALLGLFLWTNSTALFSLVMTLRMLGAPV